MEWINVDDRLPENDRTVLVTDGECMWSDRIKSGTYLLKKFRKVDGARIISYRNVNRYFIKKGRADSDASDITHWTELPDYPSAKDNNGMD